jgi:hypothetical protein
MPAGRPDRPVFSEGQYIGAADLNAVIEYARDDHRRSMLSAQSWGIAVGLDLIELTNPAGDVELYIEPGVAWDGYGRPIIVLAPALVTPDLFAGQLSADPQVWLRYDDAQVQASRPGYESCFANDTYARLRETFAIEIGPKTPIADRESGITIGGAAIPDARDMLRAVNQNAAVICDGSAPQQDFPTNQDKAHWLIPIGRAAWQVGPPGKLVARNENQRLLSRINRRYIGAIAENVFAPEGLLRLRDRKTAQQANVKNDDLCAKNAVTALDLQTDPSGRAVANELVWVEGNLRVKGDVRLFGTRIELLDSTGTDAGKSAVFVRRVSSSSSSKNGDLQLAIGPSTDGTDRLTVGPLDTSTDPKGVFQEKMIVHSDGEVRMGGRVGVGFTASKPRARLDVQGSLTGDPSNAVNHVAIIENAATTQTNALALKINTASAADGQSNLITFFNGSQAIGSIKATGFTPPSPAPTYTPDNHATQNAVTLVTGSADFAECLPRVADAAPIGAGCIVGVFGGKVSLATEGADSLLVTTDRAAVLGNAPRGERSVEVEAVALVGQVAVIVEGPVRAGDFIVASGRADGIGKAVSPGTLDPAELARIVGRAWESSDAVAPKRVNTIVGAGGGMMHGLAAMLAAQSETMRALSEEVERLRRVVGG